MLGAEMVRLGYPRPFAAAIVAASEVITPMMPPGLGFVLYGYLANVSVGSLFMAGIVPGFIMMAALMVTTHFLSKSHGFHPARDRMRRWEKSSAPSGRRAGRSQCRSSSSSACATAYSRPPRPAPSSPLIPWSSAFSSTANSRYRGFGSIVTEAAVASAMVMLIISAASASATT